MTNKSKFSVAALFSAAVLGGAFFATNSTVNAAAGEGATSDTPATETGHAYVSFTNDKTTPITDPSDPTKTPSDNSDNSTGEIGDLTLDAIPASLNFGTNASGTTNIPLLSSSDAAAGTADINNPISKGKDGDGKATTDGSGFVFTQISKKVKDDVAYQLSAQLGDFTSADNTLTGATITLANGKTQLLSGTEPNYTYVAAGGSATTITNNATQTGTTQQKWADKDVSLQVPSAVALKGDYTANITWTLAVVPATTPAP